MEKIVSRAVAILLTASPAISQAQLTPTFTRIDDTGSPSFTDFGSATIDGGNVAFLANPGFFGEGTVYESIGLAAPAVAFPSLGNALGTPVISGTETAFLEDGAFINPTVVRLGTTVIAQDSFTPNPTASPPTFDSASLGFALPGVDGTTVYFGVTGGGPTQFGLWSGQGAAGTQLIGGSDPVPGLPATATWTVFGGDLNNFPYEGGISADGGQAAFVGRFTDVSTTAQIGIFLTDGATDTAIATEDTIAPGSTSSFAFNGGELTQVSLDGGVVVFNADSPAGVYKWDGTLSDVVTAGTNVPGSTTVTFSTFGPASISGNDIVFLATDSNGDVGLYGEIDGVLETIVVEGNTVDGDVLTGLGFHADGFDGSQVVFTGTYGASDEGLFVADLAPPPVPDVPLPAWALAFLAVLLTGVGLTRRRI